MRTLRTEQHQSMDEGEGERVDDQSPSTKPAIPSLSLPPPSSPSPNTSAPTSPTTPTPAQSTSPSLPVTPKSPTRDDKSREPVLDYNSPHYRDHLLLTELYVIYIIIILY